MTTTQTTISSEEKKITNTSAVMEIHGGMLLCDAIDDFDPDAHYWVADGATPWEKDTHIKTTTSVRYTGDHNDEVTLMTRGGPVKDGIYAHRGVLTIRGYRRADYEVFTQ